MHSPVCMCFDSFISLSFVSHPVGRGFTVVLHVDTHIIPIAPPLLSILLHLLLFYITVRYYYACHVGSLTTTRVGLWFAPGYNVVFIEHPPTIGRNWIGKNNQCDSCADGARYLKQTVGSIVCLASEWICLKLSKSSLFGVDTCQVFICAINEKFIRRRVVLVAP